MMEERQGKKEEKKFFLPMQNDPDQDLFAPPPSVVQALRQWVATLLEPFSPDKVLVVPNTTFVIARDTPVRRAISAVITPLHFYWYLLWAKILPPPNTPFAPLPSWIQQLNRITWFKKLRYAIPATFHANDPHTCFLANGKELWIPEQPETNIHDDLNAGEDGEAPKFVALRRDDVEELRIAAQAFLNGLDFAMLRYLHGWRDMKQHLVQVLKRLLIPPLAQCVVEFVGNQEPSSSVIMGAIRQCIDRIELESKRSRKIVLMSLFCEFIRCLPVFLERRQEILHSLIKRLTELQEEAPEVRGLDATLAFLLTLVRCPSETATTSQEQPMRGRMRVRMPYRGRGSPFPEGVVVAAGHYRSIRPTVPEAIGTRRIRTKKAASWWEHREEKMMPPTIPRMPYYVHGEELPYSAPDKDGEEEAPDTTTTRSDNPPNLDPVLGRGYIYSRPMSLENSKSRATRQRD